MKGLKLVGKVTKRKRDFLIQEDEPDKQTRSVFVGHIATLKFKKCSFLLKKPPF